MAVLLVNVSVVALPTKVSVASGRVSVLLVEVGVKLSVPVTPVDWKTSWLEVADKFSLEKVGLDVVSIS